MKKTLIKNFFYYFAPQVEKFDTFNKYFHRSFFKGFNRAIFIDAPITVQRKAFLKELHATLNTNNYQPISPVLIIRRDKGKGVVRSIPVFSFKDYCAYYYFTKKIEKYIAINRAENTFGGWSLGGAFRKSEDQELSTKRKFIKMSINDGFYSVEYTFNPLAWSFAFGKLNSLLLATISAKTYSHVVEFDIANFYDNIRLDILESRIRDAVPASKQAYINGLFSFLNLWNKENNQGNRQVVGIPQDAINDMSRILANFYLADYDKFLCDICKEHGCKYFRYADDQYVFGNDLTTLKLVIYKASLKLNELNLNLNQKKVFYRTVKGLFEYKGLGYTAPLGEDNNRSNVVIVNNYIDEVTSLFESDANLKIVNEGRSLINRGLFCPVLTGIDKTILAKYKKLVMTKDYLTHTELKDLNKVYSILKSGEKTKLIKTLDKLSEETIHNAFHYMVLDFYKKEGIDETHIKARIKALENL